jgi:hypothetical protein
MKALSEILRDHRHFEKVILSQKPFRKLDFSETNHDLSKVDNAIILPIWKMHEVFILALISGQKQANRFILLWKVKYIALLSMIIRETMDQQLF